MCKKNKELIDNILKSIIKNEKKNKIMKNIVEITEILFPIRIKLIQIHYITLLNFKYYLYICNLYHLFFHFFFPVAFISLNTTT